MKKIILVAVATISVLWTYNLSFASFDCSTLDREEIKTLLEKQEAWTTLTTNELTVLENGKECRPTGTWTLEGSGSHMMPPNDHSGSTLRERPTMSGSGKIMKRKTNRNLSFNLIWKPF